MMGKFFAGRSGSPGGTSLTHHPPPTGKRSNFRAVGSFGDVDRALN